MSKLARIVCVAALASACSDLTGPGTPPNHPESCPAWDGTNLWAPGNGDAVTAVAAAGNDLIVAGFRGGSDGNFGPDGDSQGFVRRISPSGALRWEAIFDTPGTESVDALTVGDDGTIYVAGRTTGSLAPGVANAGLSDAFVALLEPDGRRRGEPFQFGDERPQHPRGIAVVGSSLFLAGLDDEFIPSNYVADVGNPFTAGLTVTPAGLRLDWWHPVRTPHDDGNAGVVAAPAEGGGIAVFTAGTLDAAPRSGARVSWLDGNGGTIADKRLAPDSFGPAGIALGASGDVIVASAIEPFVASYDRRSLRLIWARGVPLSFAVTIAADASGNSYVAGWAPSGSALPAVVRVDRDGQVTGTWLDSAAVDHVPSAVAADRCGRVFVATGLASNARDARLVPITF